MQTPNISTEQWQRMDAAHHLHPFTDSRALASKGTRIITRAEGVYLWDSENVRLLDGMAGLWCVNIGYGRQELAQAAERQLRTLPYYNNFFQTTHPPAVELAALLAELAPADLNHVFFTNSGSEANDTVVRMVRRYWQIAGEPQRQIIISRNNAYHGSTIASLSLGGMRPMHEQGGPLLAGIEHIEEPYWYKYGKGQDRDDFGLQAAGWLEEKILAVGEDKVAAFIAEPIQGAGGVIVPPATYWPEISRICSKYGILLVADEVICGFGRLGTWFGCEHYSIRPDLMPIAKGLSSGYMPIGGVMVGDRVADMLIGKGGEFQHGFTYSGHPVSAAVALANLRLMREEQLIPYVQNTIGPYFQRRLRELEDHRLVGEVRAVGLMAGIQLVADKTTGALFKQAGDTGAVCRDHSFANGLVMRAVEDSMVLSPPLIISTEQVDELLDMARDALDRTAQEVL